MRLLCGFVLACGLACAALPTQVCVLKSNSRDLVCATPLTDYDAGHAGASTCGFGDSIIGAGSTDTYWGSTFFNALIVQSNGLLRFIHNGGISGNTTAQMYARLQADVLSQPCSKVVMDGGTNDINTGVPTATIEANLLSMYSQILTNGQLPVPVTIPPYNLSQYGPVTLLNAWIRSTAYKLRLPLIDLYAVLTDPATGNYRSGYTADNIHPVAAGVRIAATQALADLSSWMGGASHPLLPFANNDPYNLIANGMMQTSTGGIATGWSVVNASGHMTPTIATDTNIVGNAQVLTKATTNAADNDGLSGPNVNTGYAAGDRMAFTAKIVTSGIEAGKGTAAPSFNIFFYTAGFAFSATQACGWCSSSADMPAGQIYLEFVVPPGTAYINPQLNFGNGTGTIKIGQVGLYNLSAMGL